MDLTKINEKYVRDVITFFVIEYSHIRFDHPKKYKDILGNRICGYLESKGFCVDYKVEFDETLWNDNYSESDIIDNNICDIIYDDYCAESRYKNIINVYYRLVRSGEVKVLEFDLRNIENEKQK